MPLTYTLTCDTVCFLTQGDVNFEEGISTLRAAFAEAALKAPSPVYWHLCFDIRSSGESRTSNELNMISDVISEHSKLLSGRCVVVAADPLHFGLARMFGVFLEKSGLEIHVCSELGEAEQWLKTGIRVDQQSARYLSAKR